MNPNRNKPKTIYAQAEGGVGVVRKGQGGLRIKRNTEDLPIPALNRDRT